MTKTRVHIVQCQVACPLAAGTAYGGLLGTGFPAASSAPAQAAKGHLFTALSAGAWHTCGLELNDRAWCWGEWAFPS